MNNIDFIVSESKYHQLDFLFYFFQMIVKAPPKEECSRLNTNKQALYLNFQ